MQQGTDLIHQLAEIRERQGKEPMPDPNFIAGFGPGAPPPPPLTVAPHINDPDEDDEPSPLIPPTQYYVKKIGQPETKLPPAVEDLIGPPVNFKLIVMDNAAQYAGHAVMLEDSERDRIAEIVVKAVKRELDGRLAEIALPVGDPFLDQNRGLGQPEKRKRGRPRKVQTPAVS